MDRVLQIQHLNAWWNKKLIFKDINFDVKSGEFVCLSGPNGSGKSTLLSIIAGIKDNTLFCNSSLDIDIKSKSGPDICLDKKNIYKMSKKEYALSVAYLSQNEQSFWNYYAKDIILSGRYPHTSYTGIYKDTDYKIMDTVIKELNIEYLKNKRVFELSGGEYQKVRIARCLCQEPSFLLFDEPVANLDFSYQEELFNFLKELCHTKKIGVLVSVHDLNTAVRFADKVVLLPKQKNCITGTVEQVMVPEILKQTYNQEFGTFIHPFYKCVQFYVK